jgi:prepilin-type N-terminal cleavage/methylation domain-containing protein
MKKDRYKYFYTLVELLMAMAIFAIISVIMMRFFNSAQQIWSKASQKNVLYSDARVALDMMAAELQSALYDNNINTGIYPFWYEYKNLQDAADFTGSVYNYTNTYTNPNGVVIKEVDRYGKNYVPQLNFIAATTYSPNSYVKSNVCEIKYIFLPVRYDADLVNNPTGKWTITGTPDPMDGGILARACTGDHNSGGSTNFTATNTDCFYNFLLLPNVSTNTDRVDKIFKVASSESYQPVINGVIDMEITCYTLSGGLLKSYNPMKNGGSIATTADGLRSNGDLTVNIGNLISGSPFPVAVKIDLYMLAERDLREWLAALNNNNLSQANLIKSERMRCFSKTIYLSSGK